MGRCNIKITKRHLRRIIREALGVGQDLRGDPDLTIIDTEAHEEDVQTDGAQGSAALDAFMSEYESRSQHNPIGMPGDRYWHMGEVEGKYCLVITNLYIDERRGNIKFNNIQTVPPVVCEGKGYASKVMDQITAIADKHQVALRLDVMPFGQEALGVKELKSWYGRAGFKRSDEDYDTLLTRGPQ